MAGTTLTDLHVADNSGDGLVSAGEAVNVSITLQNGDSSLSYPSIGLTDDDPLVAISPATPPISVFEITPHATLMGSFDFLVDPSVVPGTIVHFTACPTTSGVFCPGGERTSFDVVVQPAVRPNWVTSAGPPAGTSPCSPAMASPSRCAGIDKVVLTNPRSTFSQVGTALYVNTAIWLTNQDATSRTVCLRAVSDQHVSTPSYPVIAPGQSVESGTPALTLDPAPTSGTVLDLSAWVDAIDADCGTGAQINFHAVVP